MQQLCLGTAADFRMCDLNIYRSFFSGLILCAAVGDGDIVSGDDRGFIKQSAFVRVVFCNIRYGSNGVVRHHTVKGYF